MWTGDTKKKEARHAHLEKMPDGKILLDARWNLFTNDGERLLAQRRSRVVQPIEGAGYDGMAAAQSQAVEALSREIADTIRARPAKP